MAQSSILGGQRAATQAAGRDTDALGPSDSSDSGSDVQGERAHVATDPTDGGGTPADLGSNSDAAGTGERGAAVGDDVEEGADIRPDRVEGLSDEDALDAVDDLSVDEADEDVDEPASR